MQILHDVTPESKMGQGEGNEGFEEQVKQG